MDDLKKLLTEPLKLFLTRFGFESLIPYSELILGSILTLLVPAIWKGSHLLYKYFQQRKLAHDLHPFYTSYEIKNATQYFVPTKCQNVAPSREQEPRQTHAFATKEKLIPFFLKKVFKAEKEPDRFYILLADSGMGKTTFMINLYLKYIKQFRRNYKIKLLPLGFPNIDEEIDKIGDEEKEKTILLLDAFDEDNKAVVDYASRLSELVNKVWRFRIVVMTCRTQFFPSEDEEPRETGIMTFTDGGGEHIFRKLYISPFDDSDVRKYLSKKYSIVRFTKKRKAIRIVKHSPNLMVRPMLLSYIDDLLEANRDFEYAYQIYKELIKKWIDREAKRLGINKREQFKNELFKFSKDIALNIYQHRKSRNGLFVNGEDFKSFAEKHHIELAEMEMKSRSLLNRDAKGMYKFSHKSILEYFLAIEVFNNPSCEKDFVFDGMEQAELFYNELCWEKISTTNKDPSIWFNGKQFTSTKGFDKVKHRDIREITGIASDLEKISDLRFLRQLKNLTVLKLSEIQINEDFIKSLHLFGKLEMLELNNCQLRDISFLKELENIKYLSLNNNYINNIEALKYLKKSININLDNNHVNDISDLKTLPELKILSLNRNLIERIEPITEIKQLQHLELSNNKIKEVRALATLLELRNLDLRNNPIRDYDIQILEKALPNCKIIWNRRQRHKPKFFYTRLN